MFDEPNKRQQAMETVKMNAHEYLLLNRVVLEGRNESCHHEHLQEFTISIPIIYSFAKKKHSPVPHLIS